MISCSKENFKNNPVLIPLIIFFSTLFIKIVLCNFIALSYDEIAYSITAQNIAENGGWTNIYNSHDLFFFPPLFNWLSAFLIILGFEQVDAVRTVSIIISSGVPVLIYQLMKENGFSNLKSLFTSFLWFVAPGSIYYSISGQVETSFLFFILLSFFFIQPKRINIINLIFSAFSFSAGVWIKETALGFVIVFIIIFLLDKKTKALILWGFSVFLLCLPLFIQSFIPNEYDLFFELSNDLINWEMTSFLKPFENIAVLIGIQSGNGFIMQVMSIFTAVAVTCISIVAFKLNFNSLIIRFSFFSNLVFIPFFIVFPKKFEYYLLPVLLFSLISLSAFLKEKKVSLIIVSLFFIIFSIEGLKWRSFIKNYYDETLNFISLVSKEKPGATIGTPTPHMAVYIKNKHHLDVKIVPLDFFSGFDPKNCRKNRNRCILKNDYFLSDDEFFAVLFCNKWPVKIENCDMEAMKETINNLEKIGKGSVFVLYKNILFSN